MASPNLKDLMPTSMSSFFSAYAPFAGYMFMLQSLNTNFIPYQVKSYIYSYLKSSLTYLLDPLSNHITLLVENSSERHYSGSMTQRNQVFDAAEVYLGTKIDPKKAICAAVEKLNIELLVLGSHGRGTIQRAFLGSVSNYCVHNATCPVLVVRKSI